MNADRSNDMTRPHRHRSTWGLGQRGTALIEFTLVLPLLLILTVAAIDFGRAFFVKNVLEQAARAGVRLSVITSQADSALVLSRVLEEANSAGVTVTAVDSDRFGDKQIRITVRGEFNWIFPGVFNLLGGSFSNPMTLTGKAVMRDQTSG
jgi:Flp pilus assembly protein TadG